MHAGFFVVLEGPEAAGKSTLAAGLLSRLAAEGVPARLVREPGGTAVAEALRHELLNVERQFSPAMELLYMTTARADLVSRVIRPALEAGETVISDRYDLSTLAYQGAGRQLPLDQVRWVNSAATGGLVPDVTLVLDLDIATARVRQLRGGKGLDRMEREPEDFHQRVTAAYHAAEGPGVHHVDASASPTAVLDAAWSIIMASRAMRVTSAGTLSRELT